MDREQRQTTQPRDEPSVAGVVLLVSDHLSYFCGSLIGNLNKLSQPFDELLIVASGLSTRALSRVERETGRFPGHWNYKIIRAPLGTVGQNRNIGLDEATSDLITFLDADDLYAPDYCGHIRKYFLEHEFDVFLHGYFSFDDGATEDFSFPAVNAGRSAVRLYSGSFLKREDLDWEGSPRGIHESSLIVVESSHSIRLHQGHMTVRRGLPLRFHEDHEARNEDGIFLNRALNANFEISAVDIPLSAYRIGSSANPLRYRLARAARQLRDKVSDVF